MTTRRGFLRSLGILAATACIPEPLEKAVEFVEKSALKRFIDLPTPKPLVFVNHTSIDRKSVKVTGEPMPAIWRDDGNGNRGWQFIKST